MRDLTQFIMVHEWQVTTYFWSINMFAKYAFISLGSNKHQMVLITIIVPCIFLHAGVSVKVQWFWNVAYANPKILYLGVIVLVYYN